MAAEESKEEAGKAPTQSPADVLDPTLSEEYQAVMQELRAKQPNAAS